jgi:hypothetical protein
MKLAVWLFACVLFVFVTVGIPCAWECGNQHGACVELCRPAKFDVDQKVAGGCLCIGSDKVLRIRAAP